MPCLLPEDSDGNRFFGIKEVHLIKGQYLLLAATCYFMMLKGEQLLVLIDADWITTMRTGAVAAVSAQALRKTIQNM